MGTAQDAPTETSGRIVGTTGAQPTSTDPQSKTPVALPDDLATIIKAWPSLPAHVHAAVLALVNTGGPRP
ncbi:MAG: hypothetical protein NTW87_05555 [Planctomycetota bacterium]|nr:hypothetical protein [Planctomycetota bacterium]